MKYINIDRIGIIMFPSTLNHDDVFVKFVPDNDRSRIIGAGIISAPDDDLVPRYIQCYGESTRLGVRCNKELDNQDLAIDLRVV